MPYHDFLPLMRVVRENLQRTAEYLTICGYQFEYENDLPVGEPLETRTRVYDFYADAGHPIPVALMAYYDVVGSVEFTGRPPSSWAGSAYPDPVSTIPVEEDYMVSELEDWAENSKLSADDPIYQRFWFMIAADHVHKGGYSGSAYYVEFDGQEDPWFTGERIKCRFTDYLRLCIAWGGFPGLLHYPDHSWPLEELKRGYAPLP